jgi:hypothetical protein
MQVLSFCITGKAPPKKRGRPPANKGPANQEKAPPQKRKKKVLNQEDEDALEEGKRVYWKNDWVVKLIAERIAFDGDFNKTKKQGVDTWATIALNIVAACPDFDKDAEACRQKSKKVMTLYQADKAQNAKSGHNRADSCPWFEQMDQFFGTKATVQCVAHVSAHGLAGVGIDPEGVKGRNI